MECLGCSKKPAELDEYVSLASEEQMSAEDFVRNEEGTFNPETEKFWCTVCYVKVGMPLGVAR